MKNLLILPVILSLTLPHAPFALAAGGDVVFDVSGDKGDDGDNGGQLTSGNRAKRGDRGKRGDNGGDAGDIDVEIGFVEGSGGKKVYIRGTETDARTGRQRKIDEVVDASDLKTIQFIANGGKGGDGGPGGPGGPGQDGDDGTDSGMFSFNMNGGHAEDGEPGGDGGSGGDGGQGGDAGNVRVRFAPGAEVLSPLVKVVANPGNGGRPGGGGPGGTGGDGGEGGEGTCEDGSSNDWGVFFGEKEVDTGVRDSNGNMKTKKIRCGDDGRDGRDGNDGNRGEDGDLGADGKQSVKDIAYADGRKFNGGYDLRVANWGIEEEQPDGVIEPKENFRAKSVVFENLGKDPAPAANYKLDLPSGEKVSFGVPVLAPGAKRELKLERPIVMNAPVDGSMKIPLEVRLDHVDPNVKEAPTMPIKHPVEITQVNDLDLTSIKREDEIVFRVRNNSNKEQGKIGETARDLTIKLQSNSANPPLVMVDGKYQPLTEAVNYEVYKIGPGETKLVKVKVKAPKDWKPGQDATLSASFTIEESKVAPVKTDPMRVSFKIDRNDKLEKNFSVKDLGVTCQFYRALWFNYGIHNVSVTKAANAKTVGVQFELEGGKHSPTYQIPLDKVPAGFLDNVLNERPFTSNELVAFLETLDPPGKRRMFWNDDNHGWHIRKDSGCYAAENKRMEADPESFAADRASRVNQINDKEDGVEDPRAMQDSQVYKKYQPSGVNKGDDERGPHKAEDAR